MTEQWEPSAHEIRELVDYAIIALDGLTALRDRAKKGTLLRFELARAVERLRLAKMGAEHAAEYAAEIAGRDDGR